MLFSNIDYLSDDFTISHGYVGVTDGRITFISDEAPERYQEQAFGQRYDGAGKLLCPGFFNIHTHAPMTLLRGFAESMALQDWLNRLIFPFEAKMTAENSYFGSLLAIAEMLRFGVVSYSDMYYFTEQRVLAVSESGIKANLCPALVVTDPDVRYGELAACAENESLITRYNNSFDGRIRIDLGVHSEYISNPQVVTAVAEQARAYGLRTHIHLSETRLEHEQCKDRRGGMTPTAWFDSLGFFESPATVAHAVWTEVSDWEIMADRGVSVAACPASNLKLASGFAPLGQMIAAGVNVGIGTDGMASNNNHNMLQDIYLLATVYKAAAEDPALITPTEALRAATVNGSLAQGRNDSGSIALGNRADLIVLDVDTPWMKPQSSLVNNLVFSSLGSDVVLTMVDGQVLYRDNQWLTIDIERVCAEVQSGTDRITAQLAKELSG